MRFDFVLAQLQHLIRTGFRNGNFQINGFDNGPAVGNALFLGRFNRLFGGGVQFFFLLVGLLFGQFGRPQCLLFAFPGIVFDLGKHNATGLFYRFQRTGRRLGRNLFVAKAQPTVQQAIAVPGFAARLFGQLFVIGHKVVNKGRCGFRAILGVIFLKFFRVFIGRFRHERLLREQRPLRRLYQTG